MFFLTYLPHCLHAETPTPYNCTSLINSLVNVVTLDWSVTRLRVPACEDSSLWFDGEPCTGQDRWSKQLLPSFLLKNPSVTDQAVALTHNVSHGSCLRLRYTRLLDALFCASGNEIYAGDSRICKHMVDINAPFFSLSCSMYGVFPPVFFGSSSLLKLFAFYLCHAGQHEGLCSSSVILG